MQYINAEIANGKGNAEIYIMKVNNNPSFAFKATSSSSYDDPAKYWLTNSFTELRKSSPYCCL